MNLNRFCLYCTGKDRKEIYGCKFKYCPFYPFRFYDAEWQFLRKLKNKKYKPENLYRELMLWD